MQMAALQGGMAIYRGLGPVHALANTFGDTDLHHGMLVTVSAPAVIRFYEGRLDPELADIARRHGAARQARCRPRHRGAQRPARSGRWATTNRIWDNMSADAAASHFNHTARVVPTGEEYRQIIVDVLGPGG